MTKEQLRREADFGAAMAIANAMLARGLIDKKDYARIETLFLRKYAPPVAGCTQRPEFYD